MATIYFTNCLVGNGITHEKLMAFGYLFRRMSLSFSPSTSHIGADPNRYIDNGAFSYFT